MFSSGGSRVLSCSSRRSSMMKPPRRNPAIRYLRSVCKRKSVCPCRLRLQFAMADASPNARKLKLLGACAGLSIREVAHALGMEHELELPSALTRTATAEEAPAAARADAQARPHLHAPGRASMPPNLRIIAGVEKRKKYCARRRRRAESISAPTHAAHRRARRARQRRAAGLIEQATSASSHEDGELPTGIVRGCSSRARG